MMQNDLCTSWCKIPVLVLLVQQQHTLGAAAVTALIAAAIYSLIRMRIAAASNLTLQALKRSSAVFTLQMIRNVIVSVWPRLRG